MAVRLVVWFTDETLPDEDAFNALTVMGDKIMASAEFMGAIDYTVEED